MAAPILEIGSIAYVLAKHIRTTRPTKKFAEKYLGPFTVIERVSPLAYQLELPNYMSQIHPVFHISQLEPATPNEIPYRSDSPPPPVEVEGELEYEISDILDSKIDKRRRHSPLLYYVRFLGYEGTDEETSWILATELGHAQELIADFYRAYPDKPGPLAELP